MKKRLIIPKKTNKQTKNPKSSEVHTKDLEFPHPIHLIYLDYTVGMSYSEKSLLVNGVHLPHWHLPEE